MVNLRRVLIAPAVASLIASVALVAAPSAQADPGNPFDVYSIKVSDLRVNSGSCRSLPITVLHDGGSGYDIDADVEIWLGSKYVTSDYVYGNVSGGATGTVFLCPTMHGIGKFRAGPSEIGWVFDDYSDMGEFRDATSGTFTVLQDARVTGLKAKRKGKKLTFTGRSSWYSVDASRWVTDPKGWKLRLQRKSSNGAWKTVKSFRSGKKGFSVKVAAKKRATYRVTSVAGRDTWSGTSKTIRK